MNYFGQTLMAFLLSVLLILAFNRIILTGSLPDLLKPNAGLVARLTILLGISWIVILGLSSSLMYPSLLQGYMQDFLIALVFVLSFAATNLAIARSHAIGRFVDQAAIWLATLLSLALAQIYRSVIARFFSDSLRSKFLNLLMTFDTQTMYKDLVQGEYRVLGIPLQAKAMDLYLISSPPLSSGHVKDYFIELTSRSIIIQRQQKSVSAQEFLDGLFGNLELLYPEEEDFKAEASR
jgi:hypothetical protein